MEDDFIGFLGFLWSGFLWLVLAAVVCWLILIGLVAPLLDLDPMRVARKKMETAAQAVDYGAYQALSSANIRAQHRFAFKLDLYVERSDLERIPFPDRDATLEAVTKPWCAEAPWYWLPRVRFRDIRSGELLSSHWCL
ncbi:MAG: hypothetical protein AB1578_18635 [Thermodesulfobacteriota bacterium]|jgi:hypothetical protein